MKKTIAICSLGIMFKLWIRGVAFISSSSEIPEYSEDSSIISSVKTSLSKQSSK